MQFNLEITKKINSVREMIMKIYKKVEGEILEELIIEHSDSNIFYYLVFYNDSVLFCEYNKEISPCFILREIDIRNYDGDIEDLLLLLLDAKNNSNATSIVPVIESFIKNINKTKFESMAT